MDTPHRADSRPITRRTLLKSAGIGAAAFVGARLPLFTATVTAAAAAPAFEVLWVKPISQTPEFYYGWPTVGVTKDDELIVSVSGGRQGHVCPFGRVDLFRSHDRGETWSWPRTIYDGPIDDRDSGLLVTSRGTILATTFTSLAYADRFLDAEIRRRANGEKGMDDAMFDRWLRTHNRIDAGQRVRELGSFLFRSTDDGVSWEKRRRIPVNSPHGPFQLRGGRILYPGIEMWTEERAEYFAREKAAGESPAPSGNTVSIWYSDDDGQNWGFLAPIPVRPGDDPLLYSELHGVEASDGTLVVQIRNENKRDDGATLQTESTDGGKTWSEPRLIDVWGHPSHLWRLSDGRLLMTYGYRREPFGQQARVSGDCGKSWSEPMLLTGGGPPRDLGYPSTVQLSDGSLVSVWYEQPDPDQNARLMTARWVLK